jgi:intein/homing endonuclease
MSNNQVSYQDLIKQEYKKCLGSPVYFMKKYVKIQHPIRGSIFFDLYPFQQDALQDFHDFNFNIILKSRQMGISTLVAAYSLWQMIFNKDKNILIISLKQEVAKEIITKVRFANDNLPPWLKVKCDEDNRLSLKFVNGSHIRATSTTKKSGVSLALSLLIIDEAALIEDAGELWTSAQPTLSTGGRAIILSCVTKNTIVMTDKGLKQIGDFIDNKKMGGYEIQPYSVLGKNILRQGNLIQNNGIKQTKIIKTKFAELECTENHKLWAYKNKESKFGWYKSEDLEIGDYLCQQIGKRIWGNSDEIVEFNPTISSKIHYSFYPTQFYPDLCYFLGLYISEGSSYKVLNKNGNMVGGSITITCGDDISLVFDRLNLSYSCWDKLHYTISNKNLVEFMEYIGFDLSKKANQKEIPSRLLELSEKNIIYLLRGIFDGDGSGTKDGRVNLTSTSKILIDQIRIILSNFGIVGSVYKELIEKLNNRNHKIKYNYDSYKLEICGRNALKYYNLIGFNLDRKQKNKDILLKKNLDRACSRDIIPSSLDLMKKLINLSELTFYQIKKEYNLQVNSYCNSKKKHKTNDISRDNILLLYNLFKEKLSEEEQNYWDKIIDEDLVWSQIKSIENSENETFDFSLPYNPNDFWCHSIIYNSILGHQTPRGVGNWFHKMWQGSEENNDGKIGKNGFHPIRMPWHYHPERDEEWRKIEGEKIGDPKKASQEFDCDFLASGENVVDLRIIEWYKKNRKSDPADVRGADHGLWVWQYPDYSRSYIVTADVARGDGSDFSACHVIDVVTLDQCAEYKGMLGTKDFGNFLVGLSTEYNNALLIVERENVGWATLQAIIDRNYPNTFYSSTELKYVDVQRQLQNKYDSEDKKLVPGFSTNIKTRPLVISHLEQYCREEFNSGSGIKIYSQRTLSELETFVWKNGKAQAMEGYNDDLVMSLGIGLWVRDTALRLRQEGIDLTKATLSHIDMTKSEVKPYYKSQAAEIGYKSWIMKTGRQGFGQHGDEDIRWLIN